jgi:hypothetical protein
VFTPSKDCPACRSWEADLRRSYSSNVDLRRRYSSNVEHHPECPWGLGAQAIAQAFHQYGKLTTVPLGKAHTCGGTVRGAATCAQCRKEADRRRGLPLTAPRVKLAPKCTCPSRGGLDPKTACKTCRDRCSTVRKQALPAYTPRVWDDYRAAAEIIRQDRAAAASR